MLFWAAGEEGSEGMRPGLEKAETTTLLVTQALSCSIGGFFFFSQQNDRIRFALSYNYHGNHASTHHWVDWKSNTGAGKPGRGEEADPKPEVGGAGM